MKLKYLPFATVERCRLIAAAVPHSALHLAGRAARSASLTESQMAPLSSLLTNFSMMICMRDDCVSEVSVSN